MEPDQIGQHAPCGRKAALRRGRFVESFRGATASIGSARTGVVSWLDGLAVDDPRGDVALVVSELCSNAVEAAPDRPFRVDGAIDGPKLTLRVTNQGSPDDIPAPNDTTPSHPLAARGRGLQIVAAVVDSFEVSAAPGHAVEVAVTMTLQR